MEFWLSFGLCEYFDVYCDDAFDAVDAVMTRYQRLGVLSALSGNT